MSENSGVTGTDSKNRADVRTEGLKKPDWLRVRYNALSEEVAKVMASLGLNTVCTGAGCPNLGECWRKKTATFMILGNKCTRNCQFCGIPQGKAGDFSSSVDYDEADRIASAAAELGLKHVVVTCVTRDDLPDGGSSLFAAVIRRVREKCSGSTVEVLISDFKGSEKSLASVMAEKPDVMGHNIETVPSLYGSILPGSDYNRSLEVLRRAKKYGCSVVKTSMMLGLGETEAEIRSTIEDLCAAGVDILVLSQYLQPSKNHTPLKRYVTPEEFAHYKSVAENAGIAYVISSPLARSSFHAAEAFDLVKSR